MKVDRRKDKRDENGNEEQVRNNLLTKTKKNPVETPHVRMPVKPSIGASIHHKIGNRRHPVALAVLQHPAQDARAAAGAHLARRLPADSSSVVTDRHSCDRDRGLGFVLSVGGVPARCDRGCAGHFWRNTRTDEPRNKCRKVRPRSDCRISTCQPGN